MSAKASMVIEREQLQTLLDALHARGFPTVGPTLRDGSIVYDELNSIDDLPAGWSDRQEAGTYRLARREDEALFGYNVGPHSWKRFLHPPALRLLQVESVDGNLAFTRGESAPPACAFIGVRACEVHAMAIQDRVFLGGEHSDPDYRSRRQRPHLGRGPLPPVADPQARDLDQPVRQLRLRRLRPLHHLVPGGHRHHRGGGRHPGE